MTILPDRGNWLCRCCYLSEQRNSRNLIKQRNGSKKFKSREFGVI